MGTGGPPYTNPLRPRVTIKTVDGEDTLYTYNAYNSNNDISIRSLSMEDSAGETGSFGMTINDHNNEIPKDNIHSVKVFLELGKTSSMFQHFLIGYGEIFQNDRPGTGAQFYNLSGFGSKRWLYDLYIHRHERYKKDAEDAKIHNIVRNAFTKRLWRPLKKQDESIKDVTGILDTGISTAITTRYLTINETFVYFGDFLDKMADVTGAVWFVDHSTGVETLVFKNRAQLGTRVLIKSGDLQDRENDRASRISYIKSAFNIQDDSSRSAGFANRLFSTTFEDAAEMWPLNTTDYTKGSSNLVFKALGQQVIIDNDARRIKTLELTLRKKGDPDSPKSRINGGVFMDKSNRPNMSNVLDIFHVDLSSIEDDETKVTVPLDISPDKLDVAQSKIWVVLFQRSNEEDEEGNPDGNGNPNHGDDHTILWSHNNSFGVTQTVGGQTIFSGQAAGGDFDAKEKLSWSTVSTGPTYYVKIFSDIRRLFARTNGRSKRRDRLREVFVPTDFLRDPGDITRYLSLNLSNTSKGRRAVAEFIVTVPDNFLFRPYQQVELHDGLSDVNEIMQVQRAAYTCDAGADGDSPLGTLHANISLLGSYNTLVGACNCI